MTETNSMLGSIRQVASRKPLLSMKQMIEMIGVSRWTLSKMVSNEEIPYIPFGRLRKFDPDEIEAWLKKRSMKAKI